MDRTETESRKGDAERNLSDPVSDAAGPEDSEKTAELERQGRELYARGSYEQAIHVWTRILFFDRGNPEARGAIERARQQIAERQRRLDACAAEASRLLESGDVENARSLVRTVLSTDPNHADAIALSGKLAELDRKLDPPRDTPSSNAAADAAGSSRGVRLRVPKGPSVPAAAGRVPSRLAMAAFIVAAGVVFAASALYLVDNWDFLVSGGAFERPSPASIAPAPDLEGLPVPDVSDLHYFDGVRLFEQERYREALSALSRVDRGSPFDAEARSLILRIEERLLRGGEELLPSGSGTDERDPTLPSAPTENPVEPRD